MIMIQNEVLDEKGTKNIQSGIQARSSGIGGGTWLQLCSGRPQFRHQRQFSRALDALNYLISVAAISLEPVLTGDFGTRPDDRSIF